MRLLALCGTVAAALILGGLAITMRSGTNPPPPRVEPVKPKVPGSNLPGTKGEVRKEEPAASAGLGRPIPRGYDPLDATKLKTIAKDRGLTLETPTGDVGNSTPGLMRKGDNVVFYAFA
ncbi:MAG TPA: hypothetical protein VJY33_24045, partial [Isosphaeraceae bacterium]|nr:hypothetical protein [Isosphaeraceae bacterium]